MSCICFAILLCDFACNTTQCQRLFLSMAMGLLGFHHDRRIVQISIPLKMHFGGDWAGGEGSVLIVYMNAR